MGGNNTVDIEEIRYEILNSINLIPDKNKCRTFWSWQQNYRFHKRCLFFSS